MTNRADDLRAADLLDRARELIETNGWWDGGENRGNTHCAATALANGEPLDVRVTARRALREAAGLEPCHALSRWNDSHDAETVLLTFKQAAERLRQ